MTRMFRFLAGGFLLGALTSPAMAQPKSLLDCPANFSGLAETTERFACFCHPASLGEGHVWGVDVYTADSAICRAAVHAGAVPAEGGPVMLIPERGRDRYGGGLRNGVVSSSYGAYGASFRFAAPSQAGTSPVTDSAAPTITVPACPDNFLAFAKASQAHTCTCDATAIAEGPVWGTDVYTGDSSICRAALHAGVIPPGGGAVAVIPEPGLRHYPGIVRNGITSSNWGQFGSSFRFAGQPR
jgi:hypothetical protein